MKRCARCLQLKPETEYQRKSDTRDGLYPWCRDCHRRYDKQRGMDQALQAMRQGIQYDTVSLDELQEREYRMR